MFSTPSSSSTDFLLPPAVDPLSYPSEPECQLFPGYFGYYVQLALFSICGLSLILKKYKEGNSVRTWWEFLLDSSKQGIGSSWIHCLNLIFATRLHEETGGDPCDWYWINIMVDVLLGTGINYILLKLITHFIIPLLFGEDIGNSFVFGEYGNDIHNGGQWQTKGTKWSNYFKQLILWLCIVSTMKCIMLCIMLQLQTTMLSLTADVLRPLRHHRLLKLIFVMIVTPVIMNILQFWVTDNFIRRHNPHSKNEEHPQGEPLLVNNT